MKRKMKYALLCMGMMLFSMQGMAQSEGSAGPEPKKEHFREIPNPEKTARKEAEHLKKELDLTEKQYKKVYKLLLKGKHSVNHVFLSPTSIINFTSKKQSYDDTRRSSRDNELLQRAQSDL